MNRVFSKLECDCSVIEDTLGSSTGITDNNVMSYMGLVEQRTNELLTIQAFLTSKVTRGSVALSCCFFRVFFWCFKLLFRLLAGSGKGLQPQRPCQIPFGSKSGTAQAEH